MEVDPVLDKLVGQAKRRRKEDGYGDYVAVRV